jgi:hypothetical protein
MRKVRFLVSVQGTDFGAEAGQIVEMPEALARRWADGTRAELVQDERKGIRRRSAPEMAVPESAPETTAAR